MGFYIRFHVSLPATRVVSVGFKMGFNLIPFVGLIIVYLIKVQCLSVLQEWHWTWSMAFSATIDKPETMTLNSFGGYYYSKPFDSAPNLLILIC